MTKEEARRLNLERSAILKRVKGLIVERLNLDIDADKIDDDSPLFAMGLGLDSIDSLELVVGVEEDFNVQIGDDDLQVFLSVNTLVDYIMSKSKKAAPQAREGWAALSSDIPWIAPYSALRESALLYEAQWRILEIPDQDGVLDFIAWLVAGRDLLLEPNRALHTMLLDDEGRIVDLVYVLSLDDAYWLLLSANNQRSREWVAEYAEEQGIAVRDITESKRVVVVEGPYSWKVVKPIVGFEVTGLSYLRSMSFEWNDRQLIALRTSVTNEYGFRLFVPSGDAPALRQNLLEAAGDTFLYSGEDTALIDQALATASAEVRFPRYGITIAPGSDPVSNELRWMVDWTKSAFVGKESARVAAESGDTGIVGFLLPSDFGRESIEGLFGVAVRVEGEAIGEVRSLNWSPYLGRCFGYAAMRREWAYAGNPGYVLDGPSGQVPIATCSTPIFLTESARVQME